MVGWTAKIWGEETESWLSSPSYESLNAIQRRLSCSHRHTSNTNHLCVVFIYLCIFMYAYVYLHARIIIKTEAIDLQENEEGGTLERFEDDVEGKQRKEEH